jgi:hypothetical protein
MNWQNQPDGPVLTMPATSRVCCREIVPGDLDALLTLLHRGFPERSRENLALSLERLTDRSAPAGYPKYGYVVEANERLVGAILLIFSSTVTGGVATVRCNVASWYVEPDYRGYASLLVSRALAKKHVTFLNLSPAPHTWPILDAHGFKQWCSGLFAAVPALTIGGFGVRVTRFSDAVQPGQGLSQHDIQLLRDHESYGCISVICDDGNTRHPFVFGPRRWIKWRSVALPFSLLAYSRSVDDFVRFAGPLGRFLVTRGVPLVFIDASDRIPGLVGKYLDWGPKFVRGPNPPPLCDIAYTERVMFNL